MRLIHIVLAATLSLLSVVMLNTTLKAAQPEAIPDGSSVSGPALKDSASDSGVKLIVYYFHGKKRCMSCRTIEVLTHDAVETRFSEQLKSGRIEWQIVNLGNPKFAHFKDDFSLYTQSVVLVEMKGETRTRWKNLPDVWKLTRDKEAFYDYITTEVNAFLKDAQE